MMSRRFLQTTETFATNIKNVIWSVYLKMKRSIWIYFPLIIILSYVLPRILFGDSSSSILFWLIYGAAVGFGTLIWIKYKAKKVAGTDKPEIYEPRQKRTITVLLGYKKAFEVCRQAVDSLNPAQIKVENFSDGILKFRTPFHLHNFGHNVTVNLKKLTENLTEIEISTLPIPRIARVDSGYSWKIVEDFCNFVQAEDAVINQKLLIESATILDDVYVKPFQKEKV